MEELSKELERNPRLARSLARKLIEYIEPELTVSYQISKMVEQLSKIAEEQKRIWQEIRDLKEEQIKIREDFNEMLATIKEMQVQQRSLEKGMERMYERLSASIFYAFSELSKFAGITFEEFVRRFLTDRMIRAGEIPEGSELRRAVVDGEEIDIFLEEPLIVGEVTAHAESAAEVDKLLRKASKVREVYGREPRKILVVETTRKDVARELRKRARERDIELVIGKEY